MTSKPEAYLIEPDDLEKLRNLASRLHGGTDKERDDGHLIWLIVCDVEGRPMTAADFKLLDQE